MINSFFTFDPFFPSRESKSFILDLILKYEVDIDHRYGSLTITNNEHITEEYFSGKDDFNIMVCLVIIEAENKIRKSA